VEKIEKTFKVRKNIEVKEFIGCQFKWKPDGKSVILHQTRIVDKLLEAFGDEVKKMKIFGTPGVSGIGITQLGEDEEELPEDLQKRYRSGVGTLLYLVKHSRPDLSNCVRELSKVMMKSGKHHYQLLMRAIKYVMDTRLSGIRFEPSVFQDGPWVFETFVDSDWAGDKETRKSVSGWCLFINECLIGWGSKGQNVVACSSSEAEYIAISDVVKKILFVRQIVVFLGVTVKYPIMVNVDNVGAIYMANGSEGKRTKHMDIKFHFVRQYTEDGILKIIFVRSEDNFADPFTKHATKVTFDKLHEGYMVELGE
jgi:hypothetical protein